MALGGWLSYDAIEPYLAALTEANIIESMSAVELWLANQGPRITTPEFHKRK